jgi:hypothetical protein
MITINKPKDIPVPLYTPEDDLVGLIEDVLSFNDVRLQIIKQNVKGYYVIINEQRVFLYPDGSLNHLPKGLFDVFNNQVMDILEATINRGK